MYGDSQSTSAACSKIERNHLQDGNVCDKDEIFYFVRQNVAMTMYKWLPEPKWMALVTTRVLAFGIFREQFDEPTFMCTGCWVPTVTVLLNLHFFQHVSKRQNDSIYFGRTHFVHVVLFSFGNDNVWHFGFWFSLMKTFIFKCDRRSNKNNFRMFAIIVLPFY